MGLNISRQTTGEEIGTITAFQEQGHFDLNRYRKVLAQNHLTPAVFEAGLRNDILRGMTLAAIDRFPVVTEDELARHLTLAEEKMTFVTCSLATERFRDRVQPTREELVRFYDEQRENYRPGQQLKLQYLLFSKGDDLTTIHLTDEDIAARYDAELHRFVQPEARRARHILLKRINDPAALRQKADEILQRLKTGENFSELAKTFSQDSSAAQGGDLGFFPRGAMVPSFETAVFGLQVGETSGIVESDFGLHIIRLDDIREARQQSLNEVRDTLGSEIRSERAAQLTMERAAAAYEEIIRAGSMTAYAQQRGQELPETNFFDQEHPPDNFMKDKRFLDVAFRLQQGELSSLTEIEAGYVLMYAIERRLPDPPPLEQVEDRVRQDLVRREAHTLAQNAATELLVKAREGGDLSAAARNLGFTAVVSPPITHDPASQSASGLPAALLREAFKLTITQPFPGDAVEADNAYHVFQLLDRRSQPGTLSEEQRSLLLDNLLVERREALTMAWLENVEKQAKIKTHSQFQK